MFGLLPLIKIQETDMGSKTRAQKAIQDIQQHRPVEFNKAMMDYVNSVLRDARRLCPIGTPFSTGIKGYVGGTLRHSIRLQKPQHVPKGSHVAGRDVGLDFYIIAGGPPFRNPNTGRIVDYAQAVHEGTMKMAPRPFLTMALDMNRPKQEKAVKEYLDSIERRWGGS